MLCIKKGVWTLGLPVLLSALSVIHRSLLLFTAFIVVHFLVVGIIPAFRHGESVWMFVIVVFSTIPVNVYLLKIMVESEMFFYSYLLVDILKGIVYYITILSVEEVILGVITRIIWRKQYRSII